MVGLEIIYKAWKLYDYLTEHKAIVVVWTWSSPAVEYQAIQEPPFTNASGKN